MRKRVFGLLSFVTAGVATTALVVGMLLALAKSVQAGDPINPAGGKCAGCLTAADQGNYCDTPGTCPPKTCPTCTCTAPNVNGGTCG